MPSERNASIDGLDELGVSTLRVGVAHIIDNGDAEGTRIARGFSSGKGQSLTLGCAISPGDVIVVGRTG